MHQTKSCITEDMKMERGPCRGAVAHICRKVPTGYNGVPKFAPKSTPSRGTIPKPQLPASSLDPSDL